MGSDRDRDREEDREGEPRERGRGRRRDYGEAREEDREPRKGPTTLSILRRWVWILCLLWLAGWGLVAIVNLKQPAITWAAMLSPPLLFGYMGARALDKLLVD